MRRQWVKSTVIAISMFACLQNVFADAYDEALEKYKELDKSVKLKENEILELRKTNPACLLRPVSRSIVHLEVKLPTREQKRYYFKQVTYVRARFYCTRCNKEHNYRKCKTSAKMSWPRWRDHYDKINDTTMWNKKIDARMS